MGIALLRFRYDDEFLEHNSLLLLCVHSYECLVPTMTTFQELMLLLSMETNSNSEAEDARNLATKILQEAFDIM